MVFCSFLISQETLYTFERPLAPNAADAHVRTEAERPQ
jgi:hypothetical protein